MNKRMLIVFLTLTFQSAFAFDYKKVEVDLVGKGVLSYYFWDIYEVSYLKSKDSKVEVLELKYLRDVKRKHSISGWKKGLEGIEGVSEELNWLIASTSDIAENDKLSLYRYDGSNVLIVKNGKLIAEKKNSKSTFKVILAPWIGENPVDVNLKKKLFGRKK